MKHRGLFYAVLLAVIFSACRDKGEYSYEGILLDSCGVNPIAYAEISVYAGNVGDRTTTTNAKGYFKISGSWDQDGGLKSKPVIPAMVIRDSQNKRVLDFDFMPEGEHNLGSFTGFTTFQIPFRIDTAAYGCADCSYRFEVMQQGSFNIRSWSSEVLETTTNGVLIVSMPFLFIEPNTHQANGPVLLTFQRKDSVTVTYPEIDITELLKLCAEADTLTIKL